MQMIPVPNPTIAYDTKAHIEALEAKRQTITSFADQLGVMLSILISAFTRDPKTLHECARFGCVLRDFLEFDTAQTLAILQKQAEEIPKQKALRLAQDRENFVRLCDERARMNERIEEFAATCKSVEKDAPEVARGLKGVWSIMAGQLADQLAQTDNLISLMQANMEKSADAGTIIG